MTIKEYMNELVISVKGLVKLSDIKIDGNNYTVSVCQRNTYYDRNISKDLPTVQVFTGIEDMAKTVRKKLEVKELSGESTYDAEYYFMYKGVRFFQLGTSEDNKL